MEFNSFVNIVLLTKRRYVPAVSEGIAKEV
jgi:hypothetical protein